jgi:hypothetical protein
MLSPHVYRSVAIPTRPLTLTSDAECKPLGSHDYRSGYSFHTSSPSAAPSLFPTPDPLSASSVLLVISFTLRASLSCPQTRPKDSQPTSRLHTPFSTRLHLGLLQSVEPPMLRPSENHPRSISDPQRRTLCYKTHTLLCFNPSTHTPPPNNYTSNPSP